jgi:hypothetical protein
MTSLQAKLFGGHGEVAAVLNSKIKAAADNAEAPCPPRATDMLFGRLGGCLGAVHNIRILH